MKNWKTVKLSELGTIVGGATPATSREEYYNGDIPWLTPKDLAGYSARYISRGERNITKAGLESCSAKMLPKGTVLFSSRAPIGYVAIAQNDVCTNQGFKSIIPNADVNPLFLYYLLKYNKEKIEAVGSGTTFKEVSRAAMKNVEVNVPTKLNAQDKIASILDSIDSKIESNNVINNKLQEQLRAVFKARFMDKYNNKLKRIPLSELCHIITKGTTPTTLGKPFVKSGINFIKAESILDNHSIDKNKFAFIDEETNILLKRSIIKAGDIVFTIAGTLGRFALIDETVLPANTNQAVAIIRADVKRAFPEYIYSCFIGEWHTDYYAKRVQQAVQANLSLTTIKSLPIPMLSDGEMSDYLKLILPIIKTIKTNEAQNEKLAVIRDTLLSAIMSGRLDVSGIQS